MKILAFSDLHRDVSSTSTLLETSKEADVVVAAGDFGTKGKGSTDTLQILEKCQVPVILVHGNHDNPREVESICQQSGSLRYLHGTSTTVGETTFFGLGGEIPSRNDFLWNAAVTEARAAELLAECPPNAVLVTHTPPHGVADLQKNGDHEGSVAIREAIIGSMPQLLLCGHIHYAWGSSGRIASTFVQNLGPIAHWFEV